MEEFTDEWLETTLRATLAPEPMPSEEAQAFALGLTRLLPRPERPTLLARLLPSGQPLASARGSEAQQRIYETDQHLLTLWDETDTGESRYVIGQVYDKTHGPLHPQEVAFFSPHSPERHARQEGSEFHLEKVAPGTYALRCSLPELDILVTGVEVGQ